MRVVGLDIGSYSIKLAELSVSGSLSSVIKLEEYPLSQKPGTDYELEVISTLKQVLSAYSREYTHFVLGLSQEQLSIRSLFFPFKERFKILKSLPFELEDEIPFPAMECVFDAKMTGLYPNGSRVLAVASPKQHVRSAIDLAKDLQFEPHLISLEAFALNNLFENISAPLPQLDLPLDELDDEDDDGESDKSKKNEINETLSYEPGEGILNIGHRSSIFIVRSKGTLVDARRIEWGGYNFSHALAKRNKIQISEASEVIRASKGLILNKEQGNSTDWELSEALSEEVTKLGQILRLTVLETQGSHLVDIKGIGLMGGLANMANLGAKITQEVQIPCNKIVKIKHYPELDFKNSAHGEISMGVALGLAMEALRKPKNPAVNFLKGEFASDSSYLKKFWEDWGFYAQLGLLAFVLFVVYANLRMTWSDENALLARSKMKSTAQKALGMTKSQATEAKLSRFLSSISKREKTKTDILNLNTNKSALFVLREVSKRTRKGQFDLNEFFVRNNEVTIDGQSRSRTAIDQLELRLKTLAKGKVRRTRSNSRVKPGSTGFRITFKTNVKP